MTPAHDFVFKDLTGYLYRVRLMCGRYWLFDWQHDHWRVVIKLRGDELPELRAGALPLDEVLKLNDGGLPWLTTPPITTSGALETPRHGPFYYHAKHIK